MSAPLALSPTLPIGTLVEDPSALPDPQPPLMKRMCCRRLPVPDDAPAGTPAERCEMVIGWVICAAELAGHLSDGTCEACATRGLDDRDTNQPASKS